MRGARPGKIVTPAPVTAVPPAPSWLSKEAKAEWKRVAPILVDERRTLTEADLPTLAAYCAAFGQLQEACRILASEGLTYRTEAGIPKPHPAAKLRHDAMTQLRQLGSELGLTPVSRSRPTMRDSEDDDSLLD
ncbi:MULTISPECIES: phage terminase small subunit P27 family [unclassified Xanthobacter]|uniref:phage terminase small subunit P27 family n=1 Tax=unclassified Xanthobacter TaxID=2623496 RepID=UPI001F46611E|nr:MULTISPECIES: phage terminase small subunit P27 family [unclassified Xanthobacter]